MKALSYTALPDKAAAMTTPKITITDLDPNSLEGRARIEKLERELEEGKARVRKHGGKSFEGFYIDKSGMPRSLGEDD